MAIPTCFNFGPGRDSDPRHETDRTPSAANPSTQERTKAGATKRKTLDRRAADSKPLRQGTQLVSFSCFSDQVATVLGLALSRASPETSDRIGLTAAENHPILRRASHRFNLTNRIVAQSSVEPNRSAAFLEAKRPPLRHASMLIPRLGVCSSACVARGTAISFRRGQKKSKADAASLPTPGRVVRLYLPPPELFWPAGVSQ